LRGFTISHICCNFLNDQRAEKCPSGCPVDKRALLTMKSLLHINNLMLSATLSIFLSERKTYGNNSCQTPSKYICFFHKVKMS
jgi:hypothetical protein